VTVTKHDIAEYYSDPKIRAHLLAQLQDTPVLVALSTPKGESVYRRNHPSGGKDIVITQAVGDSHDKQDLAWFTDRRYSEFHPVVGKKTTRAWVDVDPGTRVTLGKLKPLVKEVHGLLKELPGIKDVEIAYSGGRGFHVRADLDKAKDVDSVRRELNAQLEKHFGTRKGIVSNRPPRANQIRLDTSTLRNKGSVRAVYSINSETGRVALPVELENLDAFNPSQAELRTILNKRESAPGIPGSKRTFDLPDVTGKTWTLSIQEHKARKAGPHWDLRLVDPHTSYAHSWALPKSRMPLPGDKPVLAVQTPTHTARYALGFGARTSREIPKGYGAGTVKILKKNPVEVESTGDKVRFSSGENDYTLFRTKDNMWMLKNTSLRKQARAAGYQAAMLKIAFSSVDRTQRKQLVLSTGEGQQPLESNDEQLPAGLLAGMIQDMEVPGRERQQIQGENTVEARLNRPTSWGPKEEISQDTASGPSPIGLHY
jgi:DNA primase